MSEIETEATAKIEQPKSEPEQSAPTLVQFGDRPSNDPKIGYSAEYGTEYPGP